jgi:hypothetical protein
MKNQILALGIGALLVTTTAPAAPLAGCYQLNPPGYWAELLLGGQAGQAGNEISAWDGATYSFYGAKIADVQADTTGEWDWITKYQGGTLVLSNVTGAAWLSVCDDSAETLVSFAEVTVKTRSTRFATNDPGQLEFELGGASGAYEILATYAGKPTVTPQDTNLVASAALTSSEICVGKTARMNVMQSSLNIRSQGVMPLVVYGSRDLRVRNIDPATVKLQCAPALRHHYADVNQDGRLDMLLKFSTPAVAPSLMETTDKTTTSLVLTAALMDGTPLSAKDQVRILNKARPTKPARPGKGKGRG